MTAFTVFDNACIQLRVKRVQAASSVEAYRQIIREFATYCMGVSMGEIEVQDIPKLYDAYLIQKFNRGRTYSNSTYNKYVSVLRTFLKFVLKYYKLGRIEFPDFKQKVSRLPKHFPQREVQRLFEIARLSNFGVRNHFLVSFLLLTGLRRSEFRGLQLGDIDFDDMRIHVRHTKGGGERIIPLPFDLVPVIERYLDTCDIYKSTDYIFGQVGAPNTPLTNQAIDQIIHRLVSKLPTYRKDHPTFGYRCHTFRHTYAVSLLRNHVPLRVITELLGHTTVLSTQIYTKLATEDLRELAQPALSEISKLLEGSHT